MTPPNHDATFESLTDQIYRPRLVEGPALGSRGTALGLSIALYTLFGAGLLALMRPTRSVEAPRASQVIVLQEFETLPPPPPPAMGSPAAPSSPVAGTAPVPTTEVSTPAVLPLQPKPLATSTEGAGSSMAQGSSSGTLQGAPGGVAGGVAGGVSGGMEGSSLQPPRFDAAYLHNPEPDYPSLSKRLGEEGRVLLRVLVNVEGRPDQVELRQSSGHARLDQAALDTVRRWRFSPARKGSDLIAAWVLVPLSFQLDA
jgi:protein TonB